MWSTICTIHDLCNWLWFAGCGENCKCFVYVCVRFWKFIKVFCIVLYILMALLVHCSFFLSNRASSCCVGARHSSRDRRNRPDHCGLDENIGSTRTSAAKMSPSELPNAGKKKRQEEEEEENVFSFFPSCDSREGDRDRAVCDLYRPLGTDYG